MLAEQSHESTTQLLHSWSIVGLNYLSKMDWDTGSMSFDHGTRLITGQRKLTFYDYSPNHLWLMSLFVFRGIVWMKRMSLVTTQNK